MEPNEYMEYIKGIAHCLSVMTSQKRGNKRKEIDDDAFCPALCPVPFLSSGRATPEPLLSANQP